MSERIWDYTALSTFLECRKKFEYRMVKHLTPKHVSPALTFGKAIHEGLATYYTKGLEPAIAKFREVYTDEDTHGDTLRTPENGVKLLEWYGKVYKHEPLKVVGEPEIGFVFPIGNILYGGRIDLPIDWSGELWIMEHKTTSVLGYTYFKQFEMDFQITGYIVSAEALLKKKCTGCMVNALQPWNDVKKVSAKTKAPEQHFARNPMVRTKRDKDRFMTNVQRIARDATWCTANGEFYEADMRTRCFSYNYDCPYKTLCLYGDDPRFIENDYIVEPWAPYVEEGVQKDGKSSEV